MEKITGCPGVWRSRSSVQNAQLNCAKEENEHLMQVLAETMVEFEALKTKHKSESKM